MIAAVFMGAAASAASEETTQPLLVIQRSKNANEFHYDARVLASGQLDEKHPIDSYCLFKAEDGRREPISRIQNIAYGFEVGAPVDGQYPLALKAFPEHATKIVKVGDKWRIQTLIAGQAAYLQRIFIRTDESGAMLKVVSVDYFGETTEGKPVQEHSNKN